MVEFANTISFAREASLLFAVGLSAPTRDAIKAALLRYCELDTLAMVMIVEAWREWANAVGGKN